MSETETYPVAEGARRLGVTEALYLARLRARQWPGHKPGRHWRLTEADIAAAFELCARPATAVADTAGLTRTSRRRITRPKK